MSACARVGQWKPALRLLDAMDDCRHGGGGGGRESQAGGPDVVAFSAVLHACANGSAPRAVVEALLLRMAGSGVPLDVVSLASPAGAWGAGGFSCGGLAWCCLVFAALVGVGEWR